MPGLDGTGPMGKGSMTGRGAGFCNPGFSGKVNRNIYRAGLGCGLGRGSRWFSSAVALKGVNSLNVSKDDRRRFLQCQKEILQVRLKEISEALQSYDNTSEDK